MKQSNPLAGQYNARLFTVLALSFAILTTPLANLSAASRQRVATRSEASGKADNQSSKAAANDVFAKPLEAANPAAPEAVPAPAPLPAAPPVGSVTSSLTASLLAVNGGIDADNDGKADPGDTIAYTLSLANASGAGASQLAIANPLDSHTTFVGGSLNSTPVAFDQSVSLNEDATLVITLQGQDPDGTVTPSFSFKKSDGTVFPSNPTTIATAHGTIGNFGSLTCDANGVCSQQVTYTPAADYNGSDSFSFKANDNTANSNENGLISITVNPVNDAPTFTAPGNPTSVSEDAGAQTVTNFVTNTIRPAQSGNSTEDTQTVSFVITNVTHSALFTAGGQPTLTVAGGGVSPFPRTANLTYTPAPNANGTSVVTYHLHDNGGTANSGVDNSADQTFTITVNAVNDAPVAQAKAFTVQSSMKITGLTGLTTGVTDPDATNGAADPLSFDAQAGYTTPSVTVTSLTVGTCTNATVALTDAAAGTFTLDPPPGVGNNTTCVLNYQVTDTKNPTPGVVSATQNITITLQGPVIWFVKPGQAFNGNGTLSDTGVSAGQPGPFNSLASASTKLGTLATNQKVFVYTGTTPAGEALDLAANNDWLVGQGTLGSGGTPFDTFFGITPPAGTIARPTLSTTATAANAARPTISGTVTMRNVTQVTGVNIVTTGGSTGLSGIFTAAGTSLIKDVNVTTASGNAVNLSGTQTVTYETSDNTNSPNIIISSTGGAVLVSNTTIGGNGFNFKSVATGTGASGPTRGIFLQNTGAGPFTITGDGSTANSGGTIQHTGGTPGTQTQGGTGAIDIQGGSGTYSFNFMKILAPGGDGVFVYNSPSTISIVKSTIDHNNAIIGNAIGLRYQNSSGTGTLTLDGVLVQNKGDGTAAVWVSSWGTSIINFNVQDSNTGDSFDSKYTNLFPSGIVVGAGDDAGSTSKIVFNCSNTKFVTAPSNGINDLEMAAQQNATLVPNIHNNLFDKVGLPLATVGIINVNTQQSGRIGDASNNALITDNIITNSQSGPGPTFAYTAGGTNGYLGIRMGIDGNAGVNDKIKILNNTIHTMARQGILVSARGSRNDVNVLIQGNTVGTAATPVATSNRRGVELEIQSAAVMKVQVLNNTSIASAGTSNSNSSLSMRSGANGAGDTGTLSATVSGNTLITNSNAANTGGRFRAETISATSATLCLDLTSTNLDSAAKEFNLVQNGGTLTFHNHGGNTGTVTNSGAVTVSSTAGTCTLPTLAMFKPEGSQQQQFAALLNGPTGILGESPQNAPASSLALLATANSSSDVLSYVRAATAPEASVAVTEVTENRTAGAAQVVDATLMAEAKVGAVDSSRPADASSRNSLSSIASAITSLIEPTAHAEEIRTAEGRRFSDATAHLTGVRSAPSQSLGLKAAKSDIRLNHASASSRPISANSIPAWAMPFMPPTPIGQFPINGTGAGQGFQLPDGKTITITFKATLNAPPNFATYSATQKVSAQATLTGSFIGNPLLSDDPSVVGAADPTTTSIDHYDSTTTISGASPSNSTNTGQAVTFTATIGTAGTPDGSATNRTGTVVFKDNGTTISGCSGQTVSSNQATCTTSGLTTAVHNNITAEYSGDGNFDPSTSGAFTQTVTQNGTTTAVLSSANPSVVSQNVTFTAQVTSSGAVSPPTGTVQFHEGATNFGAPVALTSGGACPAGKGCASFSKSDLAAGAHTISGDYIPDPAFTASSGSVSQQVNQSDVTLTVLSSLNPSFVTQNVTFTAQLSSNSVIAGPPTGTIQFHEGATNFGAPVALTTGGGCPAGKSCASVSKSDLVAGTHTITADYSGDTNFAATSNTLSGDQLVNKSNTATALVTDGTPSIVGNAVKFTATVTSQTAVTGPPSGTAQFLDGATPITCTGAGESNGSAGEVLNGSGVATCTTSTLTVATHSITAVYTGDGTANGSATFNGNTSNTVSQVVNTSCSASVVVTNNGDTGPGTLREAIDTKVCDGGTITFDPSVTLINLNSGTGELHFTTKNMTITGPGSGVLSINGQGQTRIFEVDNGRTIVITGITLNNGKVTGAAGGAGANGSPALGGAISNGGTLTLTDLVVNNGQAIGGAGGDQTGSAAGSGGEALGGNIFNIGTLTLNNSSISAGKVTGGVGGSSDITNGNGGRAQGGGIYNTGILNLNNSTITTNFANNSAAGSGTGTAGLPGSGDGGGVYNDQTASPNTVTIIGCTIDTNTAHANGGGILSIGTSTNATLIISNSTISGNTADNDGGGISNTGDTGTTTLTSVTVFGNFADKDNDLAGIGGGINVVSGTFTLKNTIVGGNIKGAATASDIEGAGTPIDPASSFNLIGDTGTAGGPTNGSNNNIVGILDMTTVLNPSLSPNGGPTRTHALVSGTSPALESGSSFTLTTDQRGFTRPVNSDGNAALNGGDDSDIGAYEQQNQPAAPNAPDLDAASDTGASNTDNITSDTSPTFTISGVVSGAVVELLRDTDPASGATVVATGTASGTSIQLTDPSVAAGNYLYSARQTVSGAPVSANSATLAVTIDTSTPAAPDAPNLDDASDSGTSNSDNLTNVTTPTFTLNNVTNGLTVYLLRDTVPTTGAVVVASGTAAGTSIQLTDPSAPQGVYVYTSRQSNGVNSTDSATGLTVTVDTTAPAAPGTPDLQTASDTAGSGTTGTNTDNITNAATRLFDVSFTTEAGSTVALFRDGNPVAGATASGASSPQTLTDADAITDNVFLYKVRQTDAAGNFSESAATLSVTFDATVAASVPDLQAASDSFGAGTAGTNSDDRTKTTPRVFDVAATESGSLVELLRGGTPVDSTAGTGSALTLTDSAVLADNTYNYSIRQTDKAGNVTTSTDLPVTIDTTADTPGAPDLQTASDTGASNTDDRTGNATHSFDISGTLAGNFVELLRDDDGPGGNPPAVVNSAQAAGTSVTLTDSASLADGLHQYSTRQTDTAGNGPAVGVGTLDIVIDTTAPTVSSITRVNPNPTAAASVDFTVTFSEPVQVSGVDTGDFVLTKTGGITGESITLVTPVTPSGSPSAATQFTVTVNTGGAGQDGTLRLDVVDDDTILDLMNLPLGGSGNGNGNFNSGEVYNVAKGDPAVQSITRVESDPTNLNTVNYTVTFTQPVTGVNIGVNSDFTLTTTGTVAGASITGLSGSGAIYTVTVNTGGAGQEGTIRLNVVDDDTIIDAATSTRRLGGSGVGNGNFDTAGEPNSVFTIDKIAPTVTVEQAVGQPDPATGPAGTTTISFTATFSESVTGLTPGEVTIGGTSGATIVNVTGSGAVYTLLVQGMTQSGTVTASIVLNAAQDAAGNGNPVSTSVDNQVTFNKDDFTTLEVNTVADTDDGACSPLGAGPGNQDCTLREAINTANADFGAETITFNSTVFAAPGPYTINLGSVLPNINTDMTINGPGANVLTVKRNAVAHFRILFVDQGATASISGLTLSNGLSQTAAGIKLNNGTLTLTRVAVTGNTADQLGGALGGGAFVNAACTLNVIESTFSGNQAINAGSEGGAIFNGGTLTITNSTISGNSADLGAGLYADLGTTTISNSTLTANTATTNGGGIHRGVGAVTLKSTIVGGNSAPAGPDINGAVDSEGYNLIQDTTGATINETLNAGTNITGQSPQLNPLADNGGQTMTHSLLCTSPAVDKGKAFGVTTDQRGGTRPFDFADAVYPNAAGGDGTDIGAYEAQGAGGCLPTAEPPSPATTTSEDTPVTITLTGTYSQNIPLTFSITQNPTIGALGALSAPNCTFNLSMTCTATVQYTPNPNANGADLFKFKVSAGGLDSDPADVPVSISATNDPPTFVQSGNQTVLEDAGPQSVANFVSAFSPGPADEAVQTVQFIVTGNTNPGLFSAAPAIDTTGTLTYTPAANENGSATITMVAKDSGGGTDTSAPQSFTINVLSVNDVPSFSLSGDHTSLEDAGAQSVPNFMTSVSAGPPQESGQTVQFVITNNTNPGLFSSGPALSPTGTLTYTAVANANGSAAITVVLKDNGGTANGGVDTSAPQTFNINVTSVNDSPTLNALTNLVIDEDTPAQIVNLAGITTGGGETQTLTVTATSSDTSLIPNPTVTYSSPNATGSISFQPVANQSGSCFITVTVKDDGGVANGGVDTIQRQFQVTVNAIDDPPVNNVPGLQTTVENTPLVFSSANGNQIFLTDIDATPSPIKITLTATNGVITLGTTANLAFTVGDGVADPTMTFTASIGTINAALQNASFIPSPGYAGSAALLIVSDDQGVVGSGGPLTDTDNIQIIVTDGGALQLSAPTYSVSENNGPAVITINRTGGNNGTATIKIDTSNGTATAGSDYTAVSQTVTFGPGETTKTVNVPITNDLINEPDETINVTLSNPGGSGAMGLIASAVLTITDDDPLGGYVKFSAPTYSVAEGGVATITVQRVGTLTQAVSVDFATGDDSDPPAQVPCQPTPGNTVASSRCDFSSAFGRLSWAAGDGADKTFKVMTTQDSYVEGPETLPLSLSNLTSSASFSTPSTATLTITDDVVEPATNPIDDSDNFVEQLYRDFLNRPSDPAGKAFWVNNINHCNDPAQRPPGQTAAQCIQIARVVTAGAFFLSIEFQATGGTAYLTNKVSYGAVPTFARFERDAQQVGQNYVFGQPGAEAILEANKVAYYNEYVTRTEFVNTYGGVSNQQYVDTLISNTGVSFTPGERNQLVNGLNNATETRATVLRKISEKSEFRAAEFNRMFVLMEYFGFLRRNPDAAGFNFWLNKLNTFNGDYFAAEMVKAFIESGEYRQRFGP